MRLLRKLKINLKRLKRMGNRDQYFDTMVRPNRGLGTFLRAARCGFYLVRHRDVYVRMSDGKKAGTFSVEICPTADIESATKCNPTFEFYNLSEDFMAGGALSKIDPALRSDLRVRSTFVVNENGEAA